MQNATAKDNIIFGKVYNKSKYETVIDACALRTDLDILPGNDATAENQLKSKKVENQLNKVNKHLKISFKK